VLPWISPQVPALPGKGKTPSLFDSSSQTQLAAATDARAGLYVCGITPYDATHIGHAATYVAFDLLVRAARDAGIDLHYVQNVTDIDDPLLERAADIGVDWQDLAREQTELFFTDMVALRVLAPDHYISAVESIPLVVTAVEQLLAEGKAYRVPVGADEEVPNSELGDVYLDLSTDPKFGTVSNYTRDEMLELFAERGGDPDRAGKRNRLDPLLWHRERAGEPAWDGASLGSGRPGWHIECAVIAHHNLDAPFDVQGGGSDLLFPHHEMSTDHVRLLHGEAAAPRVHAHGGMMAFDGEKMSKSLGNLVLVSNLRAEGVDPMAIRLALLAGHYRFDREWTPQLLTDAQDRLARWRQAANLPAAPAAEPMIDQVRAALADDLNSPQALIAVDAWVNSALEEYTASAANDRALKDRAPNAPAPNTPAAQNPGAEDVAAAPQLMRQAVDALLGVEL